MTNLEAERASIFDDQQRLRENIKSLKSTAEEKPLVQRYTRQLDEQEARLDQLLKPRLHRDFVTFRKPGHKQSTDCFEQLAEKRFVLGWILVAGKKPLASASPLIACE